METLYQRIEYLCNQRRITITVMCKESGASRGSLTDLKKGRKQSLSSETLSKIAVYFNVTVDYLLTGEQKEKPAAKSDEHEPNVNVFCRGDGTVLKYYIPKEKEAAFITLLDSLGEEDIDL